MPGDLSHDVKPVFKPRELGPRRRWEYCDLAILALITELGYDLPIVSVTRLSIVW